MKKILAMILAMLLALSMIAALAVDDVSTITVTKNFTATDGGVTPADTFTLSAITKITDDAVAGESGAPYPPDMPTFVSSTLTFAEGQASQTATINLPEYTRVGVYTYKFNEVVPDTKTSGVTYFGQEMHLVVTVVEDVDNGQVRVAAVHCEASDEDEKTDEFENTYASGTLEISKTVTGNMGDKTKYFEVTVTFAPAEGETIKSTITYTGGQYTQGTVSNNKATIQIKDGDHVTFSNIPKGATWTVEEADYTGDEEGNGYEAPVYSQKEGTMSAGGEQACEIKNNKERTPDTGITLETLPYVLVLGIALVGVALMIIRRRRNED